MTPAVLALEAAAIAHRILTYEHEPRTEAYGAEAAEALGLDPNAVFKTLLAVLDDRELVVALVPVTTTLDLKALARVAGAKRAMMADPAAAERSSGYVVGGISPLGQKRALRTFVDETIELADECFVSGGRRGLELGLAPRDLLAALDATIAALAAN